MPERTVTTTRPPRTACAAVTLDDERAARRGVGVEADRVRGADEPLARGAALRDALDAARPAASRSGRAGSSACRAGRRAAAVGIRPPPPEVGMQPMCGRKLGARAEAPTYEATKTDVARGRDPRVHGRADRAEEAEVDRAVAELRVEPADDVALRAGELVLDVRPRHALRRSGRRPTGRRPARRPAGPGTRSSRRRGRPRPRARTPASAISTASRLTGRPA